MWHLSRESKEGYQEYSPDIFNQGPLKENITYFNDDSHALVTSFTITISIDEYKNKTGIITRIKHTMTEKDQNIKLLSAVRLLKYQANGANSVEVINQLKEQGIITAALHEELTKIINFKPKLTQEKSSCLTM
jgi:hypothetical protein